MNHCLRQEKFSFALKEIPLSPAVLSDFHDAGDLQHLPFGGGARLRAVARRLASPALGEAIATCGLSFLF